MSVLDPRSSAMLLSNFLFSREEVPAVWGHCGLITTTSQTTSGAAVFPYANRTSFLLRLRRPMSIRGDYLTRTMINHDPV